MIVFSLFPSPIGLLSYALSKISNMCIIIVTHSIFRV